jgi:alanyl-tRNA synthetase
MKLTTDLLRQAYLEFFKKKKHAILPSFSLIPENDSSTLFTSSGMQSLIPYFLGESHPLGKKLTNSQKCFRSVDINEVGDSRHTTFFEMLGNWSMGDYFKKEQLSWIFEFLVEEVGLDVDKLYVTVFAGDKEFNLKEDLETIEIWQKLFQKYGIKTEIVENPQEMGLTKNGKIFLYSSKKNWWSRSGKPDKMPIGEIGGGDSEIFYDFGDDLKIHENSEFKNQKCHPNCDCGRFMEIGNNVFMEFKKTEKGFEFLPKKNVDFGGGLERILAAYENKVDIFETSAFQPIIKEIENLSELNYQTCSSEEKQVFRIVVDHIRSAVMLINENVVPSNKEQGYVLRRLIRRSLTKARVLNIEQSFIEKVALKVISLYSDLSKKQDFILKTLKDEEKKFLKNLTKGLKKIEKLDAIDGETAFYLYESFGFPFELTQEIVEKRGLSISQEEFQKASLKHRKKSQTLSAGQFKGGLADNKEITVKYHTAAHLLLQALREILSDEVCQKGSNISGERARFDFAFDRALTDTEISQIEKMINDWIDQDLEVDKEILPKEEALKQGALGMFTDRYPDKVSVYTIYKDDKEKYISKEICMGPHVKKLSELKNIKIFKQKSAGGGVRRVYVKFVD